jgi:phosphopantothenoylcysteine decarboxylase / phosphopantothenate---cysteine ligase
LITAGPTREYFDTVRFISNPSSGKMGCSLAEQAKKRGHSPTLVLGPVSIDPPSHVDVVRVVSAKEMFDASVDAFESCDAAVLTAAVCDYRPTRRLDHKLRKRSQPRAIQLQPTRDIAAYLGRIKAGRVTIGFAMEDRDHHVHAEEKLRKKRCDAIVLNGPGNVASDLAEVEILVAGGEWSPTIRGSKTKIATEVIRLVEQLAVRSA